MKFAMKPVLFSVLSLPALTALGNTPPPPPSLESIMSSEQYQATGVSELSQSQQEALAAWIAQYAAGTKSSETTAPELEKDKNWGFTNPPKEPKAPGEEAKELNAKIVGEFRGWSGKTVFRLDNGQVWRQRRSGRYSYTGSSRDVVISKSRWGFFEMRLVDADRSVGVSRVK